MSALSTGRYRRGDGITGTSSLVDELIEIQEHYAETNIKSISWVDNLKVLSVVSGRRDTFREKRLKANDMTPVRDYIAVSYSCERMKEYESSTAKSYTIINQDGSERKNTVRDVVLFRVRRFAEHVGSSFFWIDKECVDQSKRREKQVAMDSMDRVYKGSQYPVGLLSTEIRDELHVSSLALLLNSGIARSKGRQAFPVLVNCDEETQTNLLDLLELLQKDRWCRRAWIFQEEYLGGQRMMLLIRHTQELEIVKREAFTTENDNEDWLIDGEICFPATVFRKQATLFLQAMCKSTNVSLVLQKRCNPLIDCFGKYNILCNEAESHGKAMSSMIFKDIAARNISQPYDRLPITANCCDYGIRLDSESLAIEKSIDHVDVYALALYVLNGELIRDTGEIKKLSTAKSAAQYVDEISFCKFDPPIGTKQLTWLKNCRLPRVTLRHDGIHTVGLVWQVYDKFNIAGWPDPEPTTTKLLGVGLNSFERDCLFQFAGKLRRAEDNGKMSRTSSIPDLIKEYLAEDLYSQDIDEVKKYKDTMAREIVNAISEAERPLLLAVLEGSENAFAVFVGPQSKGARIFTSWSSKSDENMRNRTRHVSLSVTLVNSKTPPLMRYTGWVNGLAFWRGHTQKKAVFCWPARWKNKASNSRKRKRGAE